MNGLIKQWAQHFSSKIYKWADWMLKYTCSRTFNKMESSVKKRTKLRFFVATVQQIKANTIKTKPGTNKLKYSGLKSKMTRDKKM